VTCAYAALPSSWFCVLNPEREIGLYARCSYFVLMDGVYETEGFRVYWRNVQIWDIVGTRTIGHS
jgi:hypothetical protein